LKEVKKSRRLKPYRVYRGVSRFKVECRNFSGVLEIPCNWVKDGFCGIDAGKCNVVLLVGSE